MPIRPEERGIVASVEFLNSIGLHATFSPGATGFLRGVRIVEGTLLVDPVCRVSDLLHEAGHVAIFPSRYRPLMSGNIAKAQRQMLDDIERQGLYPDDPLYRAAIQTSDPEATAWAWAAGVHLGVHPDQIIEASQYDGEGASIRLGLDLGLYIGVHGLAHAGFCAVNRLVAKYKGIPMYPQLAMWVQR